MPVITAIPLASGSKGNATFIEAGNLRFLIDAGLSAKQVQLRLESIGIAPESLNAIFITHEHVDHVSAVPVLARRYKLPVYVSRPTAQVPLPKGALCECVPELRYIEPGVPVKWDDLSIHPFSISHDAADPVGFRIERNGAAIAVASDLGVVTRLVIDRLSGCNGIIVESNHDPKMLRDGPYPPWLQKRISGNTGHLSNPDCRKLVENVFHPWLEYVVLGHLSEQNNTPRLAYEATKEFLDRVDGRVQLTVAPQDKPGTGIRIG